MEQMRATIPALTRQNSPIWSFDKNSQNENWFGLVASPKIDLAP